MTNKLTEKKKRLEQAKRRKITIAIDGPAGSGKSTVAKRVAEELGILYLDTGAMYRAITLKALRSELSLDNQEELTRLAGQVELDFQRMPDGSHHLLMDSEDVSEEIRSLPVSQKVSIVAAVPGVRAQLVKQQREIGARGGVVMDGRDIGTVVLPQADLKIFLTASLEERTQRRWLELTAKGVNVTPEEIKEELIRRDALDSGREVAPLRPAVDSVTIDTSNLSIEQVVERILALSSSLKVPEAPGLLYKICGSFLYFCLKVFYRFSVEGAHHLPATGPVIVASNHTSLLDPIVVGCSILPRQRPVRFMAKEELFRIPLLGPLIRKLGAFPVRRGKGDRAALRAAMEVLKEGKVLGIFPEGTRYNDNKLHPLRHGVSLLAMETNAKILPVIIRGTQNLTFFRFPRIKVYIGEAFTLAPVGTKKEMVLKGTAEIYSRLLNLWENAN
ncbi:MAG: (d)CMP kinase [Firmicutes bacterium]|nr:(d)CMP kinase [Bacillota bacterium]